MNFLYLLIALCAVGAIICLLVMGYNIKLVERCELAKKINHEFAMVANVEVKRGISKGAIMTTYLSWNVDTFIYDFRQNTLEDVLAFLKAKAEKAIKKGSLHNEASF
jgi:hypothetical protein